jgi:hypothetical protein
MTGALLRVYAVGARVSHAFQAHRRLVVLTPIALLLLTLLVPEVALARGGGGGGGGGGGCALSPSRPASGLWPVGAVLLWLAARRKKAPCLAHARSGTLLLRRNPAATPRLPGP